MSRLLKLGLVFINLKDRGLYERYREKYKRPPTLATAEVKRMHDYTATKLQFVVNQYMREAKYERARKFDVEISDQD